MMIKSVVITVIVLGILVVDACPIVTSINGSCCEVKSNEFKFSVSTKSGVYNITNFCGDCEAVAEGYCDPVSDGGGWLVVQRRKDGSVDFNRTWVDYEEGFGDLDGEFWYGLRPLHCLTSQGQWQLRVDFTFSNGTKSYLFYNKFAVGPASSQYKLSISGFSGITTDPFQIHSLDNMKFTTKDRDNDLSSRNCAIDARTGRDSGGWWYRDCSSIQVNHQYTAIQIYLNGITHKNISFTEMKIRPLNCTD